MKTRRKVTKYFLITALLISTGFYTIAGAANWPNWRGPNRDNKSTETGLLKKWPQGGPTLLWSTDGLGAGYSTVSIANGTIYTTGTVDKDGVLFALDMDGKLKWKQSYSTEWTKSYSGARCTPTVSQGDVYIISGMGAVSCFDAKTGEKKWTVDAFSDFQGKYNRWGLAESPLVIGNKVIFTPGGKKTSIVALDKNTGETVWSSESLGEESAYCSPMLIERGNRNIIVTMLENSIVGIDAETGKILWSDKFGKTGANPATPLYSDGCIYSTSGYDDGSVMYELSADGSEISRKWTDEVLDNHHGGVVEAGGYIYGTNWKSDPAGNWVCLDWETGKVMYETEWLGKGSIIYADGMLYCYEEKQGTVGLAEATPKKIEIISSFKVPKGTGEHWAHPVIYDGRLYIRHGETLMAYNIKDQLSSSSVVGWRNDSTGSYPEATVPNEWSDGKNIIFKTPLPGVSNASPILINDKIFLCSEPATLICADAKNGKILWQKDNHYFDTLTPEEAEKARELLKESENHEAQLKELEQELEKVKKKLSEDPNDADVVKEVKDRQVAIEALKDVIKNLGAYIIPKAHKTNGYSSPTPTTDGKYVYTLFGTGVSVCYDMDGNRMWSKFIGTPIPSWGHSASPLLIDDKLIVHVINLTALNSRTGQILWETKSDRKWGSPVRAKIGNVDVVVTPSGDIVQAKDGKILAGKISSLDYAAPVYADDKIYFIESGGKALQLPKEVTEQINPTVLWETTPKKDRYYASPIVHDDLIYAITRNNAFSVIDAETGQVIYEKELDLGKGTVYPSIILAGERLFVSNDNGTTLVLQPGREYVEITKNKIEGFRSTPLLHGSKMYIRSISHLYCIGN